uniref:Uncharacterized protein n=1 Tax=Timema genevievae TaxID=629358 RepID=A0A7R9K638_TIMGE|nr:unnamed protein product [Timema genevievae]
MSLTNLGKKPFVQVVESHMKRIGYNVEYVELGGMKNVLILRIDGAVLCLFLAVPLQTVPQCEHYGGCKTDYPFLPAPPGRTPTCAKPGSTFCETLDHYPMQNETYATPQGSLNCDKEVAFLLLAHPCRPLARLGSFIDRLSTPQMCYSKYRTTPTDTKTRMKLVSFAYETGSFHSDPAPHLRRTQSDYETAQETDKVLDRTVGIRLQYIAERRIQR